MSELSTERIRNVAVVGHSGSGKTTLIEAVLARAGVVTRPGSVAEGTTVCDTEPEEVKRQMSLSLAVAPVDWTAPDGCRYKINLIDTPGYTDFAHEVDAALAVADLAVVVVSAVDGVEVGTEDAWTRCASAGIPRLVFVTKEDKPHADFHAVLDRLRGSFGAGVVPLELPIGEEAQLHGVVDVLSDQGLEYHADGSHTAESVPAELASEEHRLHESVVEEIIAGDDDQLERYLAGEVPTAADLERTLAHEMLAGVEFPVLLGSAATGIGIDRLADFICEIGPSPADRPVAVRAGTEQVPVPADTDGAAVVLVFKSVADQYVGQVSLFKVLSGTVRNDDRLRNSHTGAEERMHGLFYLRGREHLPTAAVMAGDLGAVAKLSDTPTGSTLAAAGTPVRVESPGSPTGRYGLGLEPVTQSDDDKLSDALARLGHEDPALLVERSDETHQTVLWGTGDMHLAVALERLARKFSVQVTTAEVRVPYRETVSTPAEAEGRVKKQSGGHGQYAVANLRVRPAERGTGSQFVDSVVGGAIPRQFIPAVERGIREAMAQGGAFGFPVVDVVVECFDGKYHSVDSSEMAFRTAAAVGLRDALAEANPVVLEPVSHVTVTVPEACQGDVLGDLTARRGRVRGSTSAGDGSCEITALVPAAELARYAIDLRSLSGGRGRFHSRPDHYDALPRHLERKVCASEVRME
ncbi:elongation factor G [soil metagenome]